MKSESVIKAKFRRLNISTSNTCLWGEVSQDIRNELDKQILMIEEEKKIFLVFTNSSYWWVLTNQRLILKDNDTVSYFNLDDINKVEPKSIFERGASKQECSELSLNVKDREIQLRLEENTWHAIYNILKFVINSG